MTTPTTQPETQSAGHTRADMQGDVGAVPPKSNYETALAAERKRVVRCFQRYSSHTRADHASSHRLGHRQKVAVGQFFYVHPAVPGVAFPKRDHAAKAALASAQASA